jgi:hypothetical protein
MAVNSRGRAHVEQSLLEVCFFDAVRTLLLGFVGTLASGRSATVVIGDARAFGKKSESSAATRIASRRIP